MSHERVAALWLLFWGGIFVSVEPIFVPGGIHSGRNGSFKISQGLQNDDRALPWPLPQQMVMDESFMVIDPLHFKFVAQGFDCPVVEAAIKRYKSETFNDGCTQHSNHPMEKYDIDPSKVLTQLNITILGGCEHYPSQDMNEMYSLKVDTFDVPGSAAIVSTNEWGALRALETFSQIVTPIGHQLFRVNRTMILDYPRFSFRGYLLDTSRHFLPVKYIRKTLDLMAMNKMNVLHWHIVDDPSFPYQSATFPELSNKGAFDPETHVYTHEDVADVIEYARLRGIRVVAEFDSPGHTLSWGKGNPHLLTPCYKEGKPDKTFGPVDPTRNSTYKFMGDLFEEVSAVFPDKYLHLGGDEVSFDCWASNPHIREFMNATGMRKDYSKLEAYYMNNLMGIVRNLSKSSIVWQEVVDNGVKVPLDTVVHVWKNPYPTEMNYVTASGFRAILSACWYLNLISYGEDWHPFYLCEPYTLLEKKEQQDLVLGGEACMWGEWVDATNVISRTWPRASLVAERLWSARNVTDLDSAAQRIENFRCIMMKRGYNVEPINGPGYCPCDIYV